MQRQISATRPVKILDKTATEKHSQSQYHSRVSIDLIMHLNAPQQSLISQLPSQSTSFPSFLRVVKNNHCTNDLVQDHILLSPFILFSGKLAHISEMMEKDSRYSRCCAQKGRLYMNARKRRIMSRYLNSTGGASSGPVKKSRSIFVMGHIRFASRVLNIPSMQWQLSKNRKSKIVGEDSTKTSLFPCRQRQMHISRKYPDSLRNLPKYTFFSRMISSSLWSEQQSASLKSSLIELGCLTKNISSISWSLVCMWVECTRWRMSFPRRSSRLNLRHRKAMMGQISQTKSPSQTRRGSDDLSMRTPLRALTASSGSDFFCSQSSRCIYTKRSCRQKSRLRMGCSLPLTRQQTKTSKLLLSVLMFIINFHFLMKKIQQINF